jgi:hypothetical protein
MATGFLDSHHSVLASARSILAGITFCPRVDYGSAKNFWLSLTVRIFLSKLDRLACIR